MNEIYERLSTKSFVANEEAIRFCRELCLEYGFHTRVEALAQNTFCIYCTFNKPIETSQRKRPAIESPWMLTLEKDDMNKWIFKQSLEDHSHYLAPTKDTSMWPQQVYNRLNQLILQKTIQTDEIRETIKLEFPDITWNDRRFSNYLLEERSHIEQTSRVKKLIMASTRLCSVVAANEDWTNCVEADLIKLLDNYERLSNVSHRQVESMVDLELDMIHSDTDKAKRPHVVKKRKAADPNVKLMSIPSCILYVRSQPQRSSSETSSRRANSYSSSVQPQTTSFGPLPHLHRNSTDMSLPDSSMMMNYSAAENYYPMYSSYNNDVSYAFGPNYNQQVNNRNNFSMNYFSPPSSTIHQRMILQQEFEQQQRQIQQMEATDNVHLPIIHNASQTNNSNNNTNNYINLSSNQQW